MPKDPAKIKRAQRRQVRKRKPLAQDILAARNPGVLRSKRRGGGRDGGDDSDSDALEGDRTVRGGQGADAIFGGSESAAVPARLSRKILATAQEQREEMRQDEVAGAMGGGSARKAAPSLIKLADDEDEAELDAEALVDAEAEFDGDFGDVEMQLSEADRAALAFLMPNAVPKRRTLGDIIMEQIRAQEAAALAEEEAEKKFIAQLDPRIVSVYQEIGHFLHVYRSGPIPKAFKIIPSLRNWEEVLYLTNPDGWSPQATFQATRILVSNLKEKMVQRYLNLVVLPAFQRDINAHRGKLNFHIYQALKKATFKPAAFFKGVLLPMAEEGCSFREATVMASVLTRCTIPIIHSGVALLKLSQLPYSGATTLFMKTLLDKRYSLPFKVVDSLVVYFGSFAKHHQVLPVIWHQNLLTFVQRYKAKLTAKQKQMLKHSLSVHKHRDITPEIHRELDSSMMTPQQQAEAQQQLMHQQLMQQRANMNMSATAASGNPNANAYGMVVPVAHPSAGSAPQPMFRVLLRGELRDDGAAAMDTSE